MDELDKRILASVGFLAWADEYIKLDLDIEAAWDRIVDKIIIEYENRRICVPCEELKKDNQRLRDLVEFKE